MTGAGIELRKAPVPRALSLLLHRQLVPWVLFFLAIGRCAAQQPGDWASCQSQDLDLNIPACTLILDNPETANADRVRAYNSRANAYLLQRSFVSAGRDFSEALKLEPANIAALTGRAITGFHREEREKAVLDYTVASRLDPQKVESLKNDSDDLKAIAQLGATAPAPETQISSILEGIRTTPPRPIAAQRPNENPEQPSALPSECDRLASSPLDTTRPAGIAGVQSDLVDFAKAIPACRSALAAKPGDARLAFQLARALSRGGSAPEAATLYQQAADAGFALAMHNLAAGYQAGSGVPTDLTQARQWFEKAARKDLPISMIALGYFLMNGVGGPKNYGEAAQWFEKAAALGNANALTELGDLYKNGFGVTQNYNTARTYYEKAIAGGDASGMAGLGILYQTGWGVSKDLGQAYQWFKKAADDGLPIGMSLLGNLYKNGLGVPKDYAQARQWFEKAAAAGELWAMSNLGDLYQYGWGVPKRFDEAYNWYRKAADAGQPNGMTGLGSLYLSGSGVPKDFAEARRWFENAIALGETIAMTNLGVMYQNGWGVDTNRAKARELYQKAAVGGEPTAMANLGALYFNGWGGPRDIAKARMWTEKAAAAGNEGAKQNLKLFRRLR